MLKEIKCMTRVEVAMGDVNQRILNTIPYLYQYAERLVVIGNLEELDAALRNILRGRLQDVDPYDDVTKLAVDLSF